MRRLLVTITSLFSSIDPKKLSFEVAERHWQEKSFTGSTLLHHTN